MYLGESEIKECPHKTVSRFYDSPVSASRQWRCDWCGQDFTPAVVASKTVEISEGDLSEHAPSADTVKAVMKSFVKTAESVANLPSAKKKEKSYAS